MLRVCFFPEDTPYLVNFSDGTEKDWCVQVRAAGGGDSDAALAKKLDDMEGGVAPAAVEIYTDEDGVMRRGKVGFSGAVKLKAWARKSKKKIQARKARKTAGVPVVIDRRTHMNHLTAFYEAINPALVAKVPYIFGKECATEEKRERFWAKLKKKYGRSPAEMDLNGDGIIDADEIAAFRAAAPPGFASGKKTSKPRGAKATPRHTQGIGDLI